ncbi:MAG: penicillin-insensitive murein endopeptidase [Myxococcota bacterium]
MFSIRVTEPDGSTRTVPFDGTVSTVGRHADNTISIQGPGISGRHCQFEVAGGVITLKDRGSTNGTFVHNRRLEEPLQVTEGVEVWVGSVKLEVVAVAPEPTSGIAARPRVRTASILPTEPATHRQWRDMHGRLTRIAEAWEAAGRPDKLALRRGELAAARKWLAQPEDRALPVHRLQRDPIEASAGAVSRSTVKTVMAAVGGFVALAGIAAAAIIFWPEPEPVPDTPDAAASSGGASDEEDDDDDDDDDDGPVRRKPKNALDPVKHTVIPQETMEDIARRYDVSGQEIADWNAMSKDDALREGDVLKIDRPKQSPLPQQMINYEVEPSEDSWTKLAERFDVSPTRLRAYNEAEYPDGPVVGKGIKVWIDPKPYRRSKDSREVPPVAAREDAIAKGHPNAGTLENGIQMPDSPNYIRRYPRLMWGNAYLVSNLQRAVAAFRRDIEWEGELVLADISKKRGGKFPPHKSHQAGRDIDIWLPTLRGVFKAKYLNPDGDTEWGRRPQPSEVDWFATFGFIEALADTGAVQQVFLDDSLFPTLRRAGLEMGATEEEVKKIFKRNGGVVAHSPAHIHHMHVRFKCAPYEKGICRPNPTRGATP